MIVAPILALDESFAFFLISPLLEGPGFGLGSVVFLFENVFMFSVGLSCVLTCNV